MKQLPSLARSVRDLSNLDALIDASIGKSDAAQTTAPPHTSQPSDPDTEVPPERFRIMIAPAVIVATKHTALQRKVAPSEIVEQALRQYLNLEK